MAKVKALFVYGDNLISEVIDMAEGIGHDPAHAAVFACGGILEAVQPSVTVSDTSRYDDYETKIIEVEVPDIEAAEVEGRKLIGVKYGLLTDCFTGGLHDIFGIHAKGNGEKTVNCSETVTRYLRAGGVNILPGVPADDITPNDLMKALISISN